MASQSLYRKWRSQTFSDLIGQEAVTRTLLNSVRDGRLAHAYLFCGPRGTGKTSAARLLAKALNCENPQNGEPCNQCVSCQEITAGRSPDVIEIDAASNNGVDNIRFLRENVGLMGSGGRFKVYIVDEAHMLSTQAWNAFLKTLEEPPPHVIFVLATTEAHKVLPTVVSRCQRFDFHRFSVRDLVARLNHVAQGEGLTLEPAAAELLARAAAGGMRDALSLLDQAVAFCGDAIDYERTRQMLGLADARAIRAVIIAVAEQRAAEGIDLLNEMVTTGADLRQLNAQFAEEWRALLLARAGADVARMMDRTDDEARDLTELSNRFSLDQIMACARVFTRNEGPARGLPVPQLTLELAVLECVGVCAHGPAQIVDAAPAFAIAQPAPTPTTPSPQALQAPAHAAQSYTPSAPARPAAPPSAAQAPAQPQRPPVQELDLAAIDRGEWIGPQQAHATIATAVTPSAQSLSSGSATAAESGEDDDANWSDDEQWADDEPMPAPPMQASSANVAPGVAAASADPERNWLAEAQRQWQMVKKVCRQHSGAGSVVGALLNHVYPVLLEAPQTPDAPFTLVLQAKHKFHAESLRDATKREVVEWALEQALGARLRVRVVLEGTPVGPGVPVGRPQTPPQSAPVAQNGRQQQAPATPQRPQPAQQPAPSQRTGTPGNGGANGTLRETPLNGANGNGAYAANVNNGHSSQSAQNGKPVAAAAQTGSPLDDQARNDPLIQEVMRTLGVELAEVRPLDTTDDSGAK